MPESKLLIIIGSVTYRRPMMRAGVIFSTGIIVSAHAAHTAADGAELPARAKSSGAPQMKLAASLCRQWYSSLSIIA